ncbi:MAG: hypothetical protein K2H47_03785 [Muribaculaceae bacterium]|nr:hypothetical protein [Muribaculaceae bacterium]
MKKTLLLSIAAMTFSGMALAVPTTPKRLTPVIQPGTQAIITSTTSDGSMKTEILTEEETPVMKMTKAKAMAGAETFTVKVISDPNEDGSVNDFSGVYFIKSTMVKWRGAGYTSNGTFSLPAGEYLMQAEYMSGETIFQEIKVSEDLEIHLNPSMADKEIKADLLMPDGSKVLLPGAPEGYNLLDGGLYYTLRYKGLGASGSYNFDLKGDRFKDECTIRTNVCDEDLSILYLFNGYTKDYQMINIVLAGNGNDLTDGTFINSTDDYAIYSSDITHTPAYVTLGEDNTDYSVNLKLININGDILAGMGYEFVEPAEILVSTKSAETYGFNSCVLIGNTDIFDYGYGVQAPYLIKNNEGFRYLATNESSPYSAPDSPRYFYYPVNPAFSFDQTSDQVMGSTAPICVTYANSYTYPVDFSYLTTAMYYGNYGECRMSDVALASTIVKYNDTDVYTGEVDIRQWASEWAVNGHEPGEITYIITNNNFETDGLKGSNVCELKYNENNTDCVPPTVQRIMMRNTDGAVTNRFANSSEGIITLTGGDFIKEVAQVNVGAYDTDFEYYTFAPATVEVFYAPYGESEFSPIEITEDPEKFFMPGFGAYYEGSLKDIDRESTTGWYDLKVVMTDEAGNTQSQIISPAFHVDSTIGVNTLNTPQTTFTVENGTIYASDGNTVEVYNISGSRIANNLQPGIYVVRAGSKVAKIQVK